MSFRGSFLFFAFSSLANTKGGENIKLEMFYHKHHGCIKSRALAQCAVFMGVLVWRMKDADSDARVSAPFRGLEFF